MRANLKPLIDQIFRDVPCGTGGLGFVKIGMRGPRVDGRRALDGPQRVWRRARCSETRDGILGELPEGYKDVDEVIEVVHRAGLARKVARLRPMGVIKG